MTEHLQNQTEMVQESNRRITDYLQSIREYIEIASQESKNVLGNPWLLENAEIPALNDALKISAQLVRLRIALAEATGITESLVTLEEWKASMKETA